VTCFEQRIDEQPRLAPVASTELDQVERSTRQHLSDLSAALLQDLSLAVGQVVLGRVHDLREQLATRRVVEILRRQGFGRARKAE